MFTQNGTKTLSVLLEDLDVQDQRRMTKQVRVEVSSNANYFTALSKHKGISECTSNQEVDELQPQSLRRLLLLSHQNRNLGECVHNSLKFLFLSDSSEAQCGLLLSYCSFSSAKADV